MSVRCDIYEDLGARAFEAEQPRSMADALSVQAAELWLRGYDAAQESQAMCRMYEAKYNWRKAS